MSRRRPRGLLAAVAVVAICWQASAGVAPAAVGEASASDPLPTQTLTATVTDLGTLGGTSSGATAVDGSIVVGRYWNAGVNHAFAYDLSAPSPTMIDLGTLGGASSEAVAVAGNIVVGWSQTGSGEQEDGFAYDLGAADPQMIDLGAGEATAVAGNIVVGTSSGHAFAYDLGAADPQIIDLGTLGGSSTATAVSGNVVVGWSYTTSGFRHAFAYDLGAPDPKMIDLGTLGGDSSEATAVDGNIVVGSSDTADATVFTGTDAFAYDLGASAPKMRDLGVPGRGWSSQAVAVDGRIVAVNSLWGEDWDYSHGYAVDLATTPPTTVDLGMGAVTAVSGNMVVGFAGRPGDGGGASAYDLGGTTPTPADLGTLGGEWSSVSAVDAKIVVGSADTADGHTHAVAWSLFYTTAPALAFSRSYATVKENVGRVTFTVTRAGEVTAPVTVDYAATSSPGHGGFVYPATAGQDFVATRGTLRFAAGETRKSVTVRVLNDNVAEVEERLMVELSAPTGGAILGTPRTSAVTIRISDQRPDAWISTSATRGFIGNKIYNTTAAGQTRYLSTRRTRTGAFYVRLVNHQFRANTYRLHGTPAPPGTVVRYYHGADDITAELRSPAGLRIRLWHFDRRSPSTWWPLRIQIKVRPGAAIGTRKSATVSATWRGDSIRTDAVTGVVRVVR